jgi:hypothetical protein
MVAVFQFYRNCIDWRILIDTIHEKITDSSKKNPRGNLSVVFYHSNFLSFFTSTISIQPIPLDHTSKHFDNFNIYHIQKTIHTKLDSRFLDYTLHAALNLY